MYQFLGSLDVDGTVLEINRAALTGPGCASSWCCASPFWHARRWEVSEEVRVRVRDDRRAPGGAASCAATRRSGGEQQREDHLHRLLPDAHRERCREVAFLLPEGRTSRRFAIRAELTRKNGELQNALERLRQIDGFKTKYANVSHELRTFPGADPRPGGSAAQGRVGPVSGFRASRLPHHA